MPRDLKPFFGPRSIAVVGAGERPTSSGGAVLQNLRIAGFAGTVIPVNPKGGEMFGHVARRSLAEINDPADVAVIVIRPDLILDAVREAAESGHRHLIILPGGFAEAGEAGKARDAALRALIAQHDLTVVGPNCAFITQSGALGEEAIAAAHGLAIPLGTVVSVGNAVQLGISDYLEFLGADPGTSTVLLYIESIDDLARFRAVARRVAAEKPVVALIGGRTGPGARAAAAHTGATPQDDTAMDVFCAESGILRVDSLRRLLLAAKGFGAFPQGFGRRVLILSNSGGPGVLCTDRAAREGLDIVTLQAAMAASLRAQLPAEASVANPLDLLADAREDRFGLTLDTAIREGAAAFDAILGIHIVPFMVDAAAVVARLAAMVPSVPLPFLHSMMGTLPDKAAWFQTMEAAGVPMFNDGEAMAECAGLLARYPALRETARRAQG